MSIVQIGQNWRIDSDRYCWTTKRRRVTKEGKNAGEETWESISYFPSFEQACNALPEQEIRFADAMGFQEMLQVLRTIREEIASALDVKTA